MTAAACSGLRWQVSSKLQASGSSTVSDWGASDCGSYGGSVGGFVPQHCCVRTLVALNNCLPRHSPFPLRVLPFALSATDTRIIYICKYIYIRVYTQQSQVPVFRQFFLSLPSPATSWATSSDCCLFWGLMFLSLLHLFAYCALPNVCCD